MKFILRLHGVLLRFQWVVACLSLLASLGISLYTVLARGLLIPTAEWVLELPMELLVISAIYGSGALVAEGNHLRVGFVLDRASLPVRRAASLLVTILLSALCFFLFERGVTATLQTLRLGLTIPELFGVSAALPMGIASFGILLWGLHYLRFLLYPEPREGAM